MKKQKIALYILIILVVILSGIAITKNYDPTSTPPVAIEGIENIERSVDTLKRLGYASVDDFDVLAEGIAQGDRYVQVLKDSFNLMDIATFEPDIIEAHLSVAVYLNALEQTDKAVEQYEYLLTVRPKHSIALNNLAQIYLQRGEYEKVETCYQKVIDANPSFSPGYTDLADVYRAFMPEKKSEIPQLIEKALLEHYQHTGLMLYLAEFYEQEKEYKLAIEWYQKALDINPNIPSAEQAIEFLENKL